MTLSRVQRDTAVTYFSEGATFEETWAMIGAANVRDAVSDYLQGKSDAENGTDSELASWYLEASAARARIRAELRTRARESAGSREATDTLAILAALQSEEEPQAISESGDVRSSSPILSLVDRIEETDDPVERDRLQAVQRNAALAMHELFAEAVRPREEAVA